MDTDDLTEMAYGVITRAGKLLDAPATEIEASAADKKLALESLRFCMIAAPFHRFD